jgi:hypothetical protein
MRSEPRKSTPRSAQDRREYFRLDFRHPVKFKMIDGSEAGPVRLGTTSNVSETGVLFSSSVLPKIASILWMDMDLRTLKICKEIEKRAVVYQKGLLGRVVRLEEDPASDSYNVGVCFVTQDTSNQELKF